MENLEDSYNSKIPDFEKISIQIKKLIEEEVLYGIDIKVDQLTYRIKDVNSFLKKSTKETYKDPFYDIQDIIGFRIVLYYKCDFDKCIKKIKDVFVNIEEKDIKPEQANMFGYEGKHFIIAIPGRFLGKNDKNSQFPHFFELQIKTVFQHAWAQTEHDLNYKSENVKNETKRKLAAISASTYTADYLLDEIIKNRN